MFRYCYYANLEMDIFHDGVSDDDYIVNTFNGVATTSGSDITLNYTSTNESFVDQLLATATSSNVHKGRELEKYNISISTTGVSSSLTSSERTKRIRLYTAIPKNYKII